MIDLLWAIALAGSLAAGWLMTLLGLPGNWLMVVAAATYALWGPAEEARLALGWPVVAILLGLAVLGELAELAAGAAGVAKVGGSRRSAILALLGSLVGGVIGIFAGAAIPIPVVGSLIGAVGCAALGAMAGAMLGENWKGRDMDRSWQVGQAAFWGRLLGTLAKTLISSVMVGVALAALVL